MTTITAIALAWLIGLVTGSLWTAAVIRDRADRRRNPGAPL